MRYYNRSQTDQDKVLNDSCQITSTLMICTPKIILLYDSFLKISFFICKQVYLIIFIQNIIIIIKKK